MPADAAAAIIARQASKLFLDGAVVAFRQLSLTVREQEILCVVGPSGCGKTTFLRCIAGLTDLSSGELIVGGKPVSRTARRRRDGVPAFRPAALEDRLRQRRLRARHGAHAGRADQGAGCALSRAGRADRLRASLSLSALRAACSSASGWCARSPINPSVLLMDEPFAALDAQTREILQEELLALMQRPDERKTMVFITHSIDEAILLGDRIAVMTARPGPHQGNDHVPFGRPRDVEDGARRSALRRAARPYLARAANRAPARERSHDGRGASDTTAADIAARTPIARARQATAGRAGARRACAIILIRVALARSRAGRLAMVRRRDQSGPVHHAERGRQRGRDMIASGELWTYLWPSLIVLAIGLFSRPSSASRSAWCWRATG